MEQAEGWNEARARNGCDQAGAYGLILDARDRILLVEANSGRFYLPGGRIEPFETPEQALIREIGEECGWSASVSERIGEAVQPIFGGRVALLAIYWKAGLISVSHDRPEHRMVWASPAEAASLLHRPSDVEMLSAMPSRNESAEFSGAPARATARPNCFFHSA